MTQMVTYVVIKMVDEQIHYMCSRYHTLFHDRCDWVISLHNATCFDNVEEAFDKCDECRGLAVKKVNLLEIE